MTIFELLYDRITILICCASNVKNFYVKRSSLRNLVCKNGNEEEER